MIFVESGYNPDCTDDIYPDYVASPDGIHWKLYPGNPFIYDGRDSPVVDRDRDKYRFYTCQWG